MPSLFVLFCEDFATAVRGYQQEALDRLVLLVLSDTDEEVRLDGLGLTARGKVVWSFLRNLEFDVLDFCS